MVSPVVPYMIVYSNVAELTGRIPPVKLNRIAGDNATVIAKLEFYNPANFVKDHVGAAITKTAEASSGPKPGGTTVGDTSGNISITLAIVGAAGRYKVILAMPEATSPKRQALLRAYGAKLVPTPGPLGMKGAVVRAEEIAGECSGVLARQFANSANPAVHRRTTAEEIWVDIDDKVDILVVGVGIDGTVSGVGQVLKEHKPEVKTTAVEPAESPILSGGRPDPHKIQGLGANFVPEILDRDVIDGIITRDIDQSIEFARTAATQGDLLVGISSGVALFTAVEVVNRPESVGKTIAAVPFGFDECYLSIVPLGGPVDT